VSAAFIDVAEDDDDDDDAQAEKIVEDGTEGQDSKICSRDEGNTNILLNMRDEQEKKEI